MTDRTIKIKDITIGGKTQLVFIAGPCVIETEELTLKTAKRASGNFQEFGYSFNIQEFL